MDNEPLIRLTCFIGIFTAVAMWELFAPRRTQQFSRWVRWPSNIGISVLNTVLVRIISPSALIGMALFADERSWGLLNHVAMASWLAIILAVLLLDLAVYFQHRVFHRIPILWRLHRMHHADLEFDVTTGARFHPIEILISLAFKLAIVALLGAPAIAVLVFEVTLNATSMFNHGNIRIPLDIEKYLRWMIVTPDMHRVHHSIVHDEMNSNFGFNVPWWDRLLHTYRAQPRAGHDGMTIGVEQFRSAVELRLDRLLIQPFLSGVDTKPLDPEQGDST